MTSNRAMAVPVNSHPANRIALRWLREARADADPAAAYLLQLAMWGLEQGMKGSPPLAPNQPGPAALESQVLMLLQAGAERAMRATTWALGDPEEAEALLSEMTTASSPQAAAEAVLEAVRDRMVEST